jgi:succinate-semialdehyde dehydrogenase/glutarate-semialdehyde dehydrogenase
MSIIQSINPATQELNGSVESTPVTKMPDIMANARKAQELWSSCFDLKERLRVLIGKGNALENLSEQIFHSAKSFRHLVFANRKQIAELITKETGKPIFEVLNSEIQTVLEHCNWLADNAEAILQAQPSRVNKLICPRMSAKKHREPHGVVCVIAPFNYPFAIPVCTMLNALVAGNSVILKHSPKTPLTAKLIQELFDQSGLSTNLVQIVQGDREETTALLQAAPNKVVFTGSPGGGKAIMRLCAENVIPLTEELGGKHPAVVWGLKSKDLRIAAKSLTWGAFTNKGEACAAVQRIYVQREIAEELAWHMVYYTRKLKIGNGLLPEVDIGPLVDSGSVTRVQGLVDDAVQKGAKPVIGGKAITEMGGFFFEPTILVNANQNMRIAKEEAFGPVVPIIAIDSLEDGIQLANDSTYFLGSSVWISDRKLAARVAKQLKAGMTWINNTHVTFSFPDSHWGGRGLSGFGTTHGPEALLDMTVTHYIATDKISSRLWQFPYGQEKLDVMDGLAKTQHGSGIFEKMSGVIQVVAGLVSILSKKQL